MTNSNNTPATPTAEQALEVSDRAILRQLAHAALDMLDRNPHEKED